MTGLSDSFDYEVIQWKRDTSGRVVCVVINLNGYCINIVNIYAPTNLTEQKVFFQNLHEFFLPSDAIFITGDFNCYEYQTDKTSGNWSCAKYLSDFRSTFNLVDAWHCLNPRFCQCTWFNSDFSIGSRLDKIFVSQSLFLYLIAKLNLFVFLIMILFILLYVLMTCVPMDLVYGSLTIPYLMTLISLNTFRIV